jgi:thiol-disulfide isomerase/thioredoxin
VKTSEELSTMMHSLSFKVWIRRALGVVVIVGVASLATGWNTKLRTKLSNLNTAKVESLIGTIGRETSAVLAASAHESHTSLDDGGSLPDLGGAIGWLNSAPLNRKSLRGKVVLIDFWTYTCINSLRPLPYVKSWAAKYKDAGLVVIGVHTPEFSFEKEPANIEDVLRELKVTYPVAIDSNYGIWQAFNNEDEVPRMGCVEIVSGPVLAAKFATNAGAC